MEMLSKPRLGTALLALAAMASALLPWVQQAGTSLSGLRRGWGVPVLLYGAAALTVALVGVENSRSRWVLSVGAVVGGLASVAGLSDVARLEGPDSPIGLGLVLALSVSAVSIVGLVFMWLTLWRPGRADVESP